MPTTTKLTMHAPCSFMRRNTLRYSTLRGLCWLDAGAGEILTLMLKAVLSQANR